MGAHQMMHLFTWIALFCGGSISKTGAISGPPENDSKDQVTPCGRKFITVLPQHQDSDGFPQQDVLLTGSSSITHVSITIKHVFSQNVTVRKGETKRIPIPNTVQDNNVMITADANITVMARYYRKNSNYARIAYYLPKSGFAYFRATTQTGPINQDKASFVALCENKITIDIYIKDSTNDLNGDKMKDEDDLSGTKVNCSPDVAVISEHTCVEPNLESWVTTFSVPGLSSQTDHDNKHAMASPSSSSQQQAGEETKMKATGAGELLQVTVTQSSPLSISNISGIKLSFSATTGLIKNNYFAASLNIIQGVRLFGTTFSLTGRADVDSDFAVIIANTLSAPGITFDGKSLRDTTWNQIPGSGLSYTVYKYGSDSHTVKHPKERSGNLDIGNPMILQNGNIDIILIIRIRVLQEMMARDNKLERC